MSMAALRPDAKPFSPEERAAPGSFFSARASRLDVDTGHSELRFWQVAAGGAVSEVAMVAGPHLEALTMRPAAAEEASILLLLEVPRG